MQPRQGFRKVRWTKNHAHNVLKFTCVESDHVPLWFSSAKFINSDSFCISFLCVYAKQHTNLSLWVKTLCVYMCTLHTNRSYNHEQIIHRWTFDILNEFYPFLHFKADANLALLRQCPWMDTCGKSHISTRAVSWLVHNWFLPEEIVCLFICTVRQH